METIDFTRYSRRDFGRIALAGVPLSLVLAGIDSKVAGVRIGVQSYSFRAMSLDEALKAMSDIGIGECELYAGHLEPRRPPQPRPAADRPAAGATPPAGPPPPNPAMEAYREEVRKWRLSTPLDHFTGIRKKFDAAGIELQAYNYSFNDSFTDGEIDRGFEIAKALGAGFITASATVSSAKRVAPFADKHQMVVAMHNHSNVKDANEFATPESFATALGYSKFFKINLDIGHFVAGGFDPIAYIEQHHAQITNLHLKDRKKDQGPNTVWGQGDTPITQVLQLLKKNKYDIPANIEYEYRGEDTVAEVRKCSSTARARSPRRFRVVQRFSGTAPLKAAPYACHS
jgi:sugar phosphate isomerase/epimerase